jgi:hypothetical protein
MARDGSGSTEYFYEMFVSLDGRYLAIKPILLCGQGEPRRFHTPVAKLCRLLTCSVGKLSAVGGVPAIDVRLFHDPFYICGFLANTMGSLARRVVTSKGGNGFGGYHG